MNVDRLKWLLIGAGIVAIPVTVAVFGVSIVQASSGPGNSTMILLRFATSE